MDRLYLKSKFISKRVVSLYQGLYQVGQWQQENTKHWGLYSLSVGSYYTCQLVTDQVVQLSLCHPSLCLCWSPLSSVKHACIMVLPISTTIELCTLLNTSYFLARYILSVLVLYGFLTDLSLLVQSTTCIHSSATKSSSVPAQSTQSSSARPDITVQIH